MSEKIAVIGAGTMGAGIAGVFAAHGSRVTLYSRSEDTLNVARAAVKAIVGPTALVDYTTSLRACLAGATILSENVAEDLDLKQWIFAEIERDAGPDCLLTTNTSSVPIGLIGAKMQAPERLVGLHWFNPPAVMPLVEIVRGPRTDDHSVARARAVCVALGRDTIEVTQDVPGFVVNRLQYALLREALHLVETGVASIADVDRAVETTLAPRWSAAGPLRLMDLAGLDTVAKVSAVLMPALSNSAVTSSLIDRLTAEGAFGAKAGRGFYTWSEDSAARAKEHRDATVQLISARRSPA